MRGGLLICPSMAIVRHMGTLLESRSFTSFTPSCWEHLKSTASSNSLPMKALYKANSLPKPKKLKYIANPEYFKPMRAHHRVSAKPSVGSLIEYQIDGLKRIGVIVSDDANFFQLNKYKVFAMNDKHENDLTDVITTSQITFHLKSLIKAELMYHSLNEINGYSKASLNQFLKDFVLKSYHIIKKHGHLIPIIHAFYSKPHIAQQLDLLTITKLFTSKIPNFEKEPDLEYFMFGLHVQLQSDPWNFLVLRNSNFILDISSSTLIPDNIKYIANSIQDSDLLRHASTLSNKQLLQLNALLGDLSGDFEYDSSTFQKDVTSIILLMEQYLKFPYSHKVNEILSKVLPFALNPNDVSKFLSQVNAQNPPAPLPRMPVQPVKVNQQQRDHFKHIRCKYKTTAYGIPSSKLTSIFSNETRSEFALSLNTDKKPMTWEFSIHIPDIASSITSKSELISLFQNNVRDFESPFGNVSMLDTSTLDQFCFKDGSENNKAITITFLYNLKEGKGWNDTRVSISLTSLENLKVVPLREFNEIWKSRTPNLQSLNIAQFFRKLFSGVQAKKYDTLEEHDIEMINKLLTLIDYWFFKRIQKNGSLENPFPPKARFTTVNSNGRSIIERLANQDGYSYVNYIMKELELIISEELFKYTNINKDLVLLSKTQSILNDHVLDSVDIKSTTTFPNYKTSKFNEIIFLKDELMLTPFQNFVAALQFLKPMEISTTEHETEFVSKGLDSGFIEFLSPLKKFETVLNHWQVLNHLQRIFMKNIADHHDKYNTYQLTKLYPKTTIPCHHTSKELMEYHNLNIKPLDSYFHFMECAQDRYAKLCYIEREQAAHLRSPFNFYRCIILNLLSSHLAQAWCFELDVQVDIELNQSGESIYQIGDQIICNQIIYMSPAMSQIILRN